jgi:hypothetical protein
MNDDEKKALEDSRDEMLNLLPPEEVKKLREAGMLDWMIRLNAWMRTTEKGFDRHEEMICRLGALPDRMKDDIGWLRGSTEILQKFIETDMKFRAEQMELLQKQDQRRDERDDQFLKELEKSRQQSADLAKVAVEATDRLTKAVEEFRLVMEKAVQDGQRPRLGPGGMGL